MNIKPPKYSIIIPTYNGETYLPTCIETIISQEYNDYELIISDDHSTDGTREYLDALEHKNMSIIYPPESLSMTEHWEWALSHAKGEWQIFVGQDDGLQAYFFRLADRLTAEAKEKKLRSIMSSRACFFWKGCEYVYGDIAVGYTAINKTKVHNFKYEALKALLGLQSYFELPQMYTTALFHKDLLDEARAKQGGKVFSCHPQDANLAAIACSLETEYLKSYIPLGWVGSSPKSAGMAIFSDIDKAAEEDVKSLGKLREDYSDKITKSKLKYHNLAGDFGFGSLPIYFWQALLKTSVLRVGVLNDILKSKTFKIIMFSFVYRTLIKKEEKEEKEEKILILNEIVEINNIPVSRVISMSYFSILVSWSWGGFQVLLRLMRKLSGGIRYRRSWNENLDIDMLEESFIVKEKVSNKLWEVK